MQNEKLREEFEAWSMKEYPGTLLARASTGGYRNLYVQMCWLGWQASRESLVIDLDRCAAEVYDGSGNLDFTATVNAIQATGLKVKQ